MYATIEHARLAYLIACIALVILGVVAITQKATLQGLAWIAVATISLGLWLSLTP